MLEDPRRRRARWRWSTATQASPTPNADGSAGGRGRADGRAGQHRFKGITAGPAGRVQCRIRGCARSTSSCRSSASWRSPTATTARSSRRAARRSTTRARRRRTPRYDGHNYYPTTRWVLFGHHFAAITGAGPLIGPVLAAQFGYAPGLPLARGRRRARRRGARLHHPLGLDAPRRRSLAEIARDRDRPGRGHHHRHRDPVHHRHRPGRPGLVVVNALQRERVGHLHHRRRRSRSRCSWASTCTGSARGRSPRRRSSASSACWRRSSFGKPLAGDRASGSGFAADAQAAGRRDGGLRLRRLGAAGLAAARPRDYLCVVHEDRHHRACSSSASSSSTPSCTCRRSPSSSPAAGRSSRARSFPFVFITIACGAISGFHALIGSGTTPKMIDKESRHPADRLRRDADRGLVGVVALIAAAALHPGDYFAINVPPAGVRRRSACPIVNLPALEQAVGETVDGPDRRRGLAGGRHGADLQRAAGHAGPDGLLVPLRDHVRGALHPDHDRRRHARGALPPAGVPRPLLQAVRPDGLAARHRRLDRRSSCSAGATSSGRAASPRSGRCSASPTSCWPSSRC